MWERIQHFLGLDQYENAQESRQAFLLTVALAVMAITTTLNLIFLFSQPTGGQEVIIGLGVIVAVLSIVMLIALIITKQVRLLSSITAWFIMTIVVANVFGTGGISIITNPPSIMAGMIFASLLIGRQGTFTFSLVAIISFIVAYLAETIGMIAPPMPAENLLAQLVLLIFITVFVGALVYYAQLGLDQALERVEASNEELAQFNVGLEALVNARTRDLQLAAQVGAKIEQIRELTPMLNEAVSLIQQEFGFYHVQVYLSDPVARTLILRAGTGEAGERMISQNHKLAIGPGSVNGSAAARNEPVLISDVRNNPNHQPNPLLPETLAELSVPLHISNRLLGVLNLQNDSADQLSQDNISTFELLAGQLSVAIENARLFDELEQTQTKVIQQAQRLINREWDTFFDHVDSTHTLTYEYENPNMARIAPDSEVHDLAQVPIDLAGVKIGQFSVTDSENKYLSEGDREFLGLVAEQVAQRVENLRLLNEAGHYRAEAETALRRMTREAWSQFSQQEEDAAKGYMAESMELLPIDSDPHLDLNGQQVPLSVQGEAVGELYIEGLNDTYGREIAAEVAASLSAHIESLRLADETERRASELAIINRVNDAIRGFIDLDEVFAAVGNELRTAFNATSVYIATYEPGAQKFELPYYITVQEDGQIKQQDIPTQKLGNGLTSDVIASKKPLLLNAKSRAELDATGAITVDEELIHDAYSYLAVPVMIGKDVVGVVSIQDNSGERFFSEEDQDLLETISTGLGITIQNASLYQQTEDALGEAQRQSRELEAINRVVLATGASGSLDESLQIVATELMAVTSADQIGVALINPDGESMTIRAISGGTGQEAVVGMQIPITGNPATADVLRTLQPVIIENVPQSPMMDPVREIVEARNVEALGIFPIYTPNGVMGTIGLDITEPGKSFSAREIQLTTAIVRQTATLIESARLFADTEKRANRERLINEITQKIQGTVSVESALQTTIAELGNALKARYVRVELNEARNDDQPIVEKRAPVKETNGVNGTVHHE